jgi:hypothetical protein
VSSAPIHHGRPDFIFDFDPVKGMNRVKVDQWPIESFLGQKALVDLKSLASLAKRPLLAVEMDWINLALAIYSADRFASRRPSAALGEKFWRRSITLNVAVANPNRWNSLKQAILDALTFLTDDNWSLHFTQREIGLNEEMQEQLPETNCEKPSWICLFSGGLDSAPPDAVLWEYPEAGSYFEEAAASLNMSLSEFLSNVQRMHHAFSLEWKEFADGLPPIKHAARPAA